MQFDFFYFNKHKSNLKRELFKMQANTIISFMFSDNVNDCCKLQ